jgi:AraC-like DNA-binding protein
MAQGIIGATRYGRSPTTGLYEVAVIEEIDEVTAWRTEGHDDVIWMRGRTTGYAVEPAGEYVIGVATSAGYHLRRGRERFPVSAGRLVVLDPAAAHLGRPLGEEPWSARLLVLELGLQTSSIADGDRWANAAFPCPLVDDSRLARRFVDLHRAAEAGADRLELDVRLSGFLDDLIAASSGRRTGATVDRTAVERARDYLHDHLTEKVGLDDVAAAAGTSKYHLVRQFHAVVGVPPHAYQLGQRILLARRLLERDVPVAEVAARAGFVDQSHLHRQFRRRLGITPGRYAAAFRRDRGSGLGGDGGADGGGVDREGIEAGRPPGGAGVEPR